MSKPFVIVNLPDSSQVGLSRPGVAQFAWALGLLILLPFITAFVRNEGLAKAVDVVIVLALWILYLIGCKKYANSKGYEGFWMPFWLALGNGPGFIVLLLLPDLRVMKDQFLIEKSYDP